MDGMKHKILVIEDEKELATILGAYLEVEGFAPILAMDGEEGLLMYEQEKPSLVLLDIMLPKKDGIQVCKEIRSKAEIPIIMISAKSGEMDKVIALGIGADDYVTKPFSPLELMARVKAQLRRYEKSMERDEDGSALYQKGKIVLNPSAYVVKIEGEEVPFTTKEFEMLYYLMQHVDQVLTKEQIYEGVWGYGYAGDDTTITVYVKRIRAKLSTYQLDYIKTVWGVGYKFTIQ